MPISKPTTGLLTGLKHVDHTELRALRRIFDMGVVTDWRVAVDGGAHVGGWTDALSARFDLVHSFEPTPETFAILAENLRDRGNVRLYNLALMHRRMTVEMRPRDKTMALTARQAHAKEGGDTLAIALDELALPACGFIKLDVEGAELFALEGGLRTIERHRPVLLVEEAGHGKRLGASEQDVNRLLETLSYRMAKQWGVNRLWLPKETP